MKIDPYVPSLWIYASMNRFNSIFLDSSMRNDLGTKSYIGMMPYKIHTPENSDAVDILNDVDEKNTVMGYLSYDYGMRINGIDSRHISGKDPEFILADFDIIIEDDHKNHTLDIRCMGRVMDEAEELRIAIDIILSAKEPTIPEGNGYEIVEEISKQEYIRSILRAKEMMRKGEFYVINITRRIIARSDSIPFEVFLRLRRISPTPFGAYLEIGNVIIISSSMELLLECKDGVVHTRPIKGTSGRTGSDEEDLAGLCKLLDSEKDRSELLMVTDLERNDLNRFCVPGSVKVESFFRPEEYSTLYHTVADLSGTVAEGTKIGDMIRCMFPGGSITGAPKIACMEAIDSLEKCKRGVYTGAIGMFSKNRTVVNIAIRTITYWNGLFSMGVGGGITCESDPSSEYNEAVHKSTAMLRSL